MSYTWTAYINGERKDYTPTTKDLQDIEEAFGKPETITQTVTRGFFQGMGSQVGYSCAQGVHSIVLNRASSNQGVSNRTVIPCKTHKIKQEDLQRISVQLQASEQRLVEAEIAKNQALEAYQKIFAKTLNHADFPIPKDLGDLVTYDIPSLLSLKQQEQNACCEYNNCLLKVAQEKALYWNTKKAYDHQSEEKVNFGGFFVSIAGGVFGFVVTLLTSDY